ncbi:MAG: hypothetical protein ABEJ03_03330 [Candidatus Nanohaloarchaea archaeon]
MTIKAWMVFEAVGPREQDVKDSLEEHLNLMSEDEGLEIIEKEFDDISEMKDPHPGLEKGFSQVCESRIEIENLTTLMQTVINYGPTYVQVEEPENLEIPLKDLQGSVQNVVEMMQQYASSGAGGMLISRATE